MIWIIIAWMQIRIAIVTEQTLTVTRARNRAFRWPKGQSGNPSGQSRFYHEARKLARRAAPQMMQELIDLALHADDERVRSVCAVAVLDRAGVRPIDFDPAEDAGRADFDPRDFTPEELDQIEAALRLMLRCQTEATRPGGHTIRCSALPVLTMTPRTIGRR